MRHILAAALLGALSVSPAMAQTTITADPNQEGSNSDAFEGSTVTADSGVLAGFTVADAFGSVTSGGPYPESQSGGHVIFNDSPASVFISFTPTTVVPISGFTAHLANDGVNTARSFTGISLWGSNDGVNYASIASTALNSDYVAAYGSNAIAVGFTFAPVAYTYYRFEGSFSGNGPRVHELDAIAAVPEPATWAMMIGGFGLAGGLLRRRRKDVAALA